MTDSEESVREKLKRHPWDETIPKLLRHTRARIRGLVWGGRPGGELPGGQEAEDLVYGAIGKVMEGTRTWDPRTEPDLEAHLRDVIGSELNHLAVGFENRRFVRESSLPQKTGEEAPAQPLDAFPSATPAPPEVMEERAAAAEGETFSREFLVFLGDESSLKDVAALVVAGTTKPAEIAKAMCVPVSEIYSIRKRLHRRIAEFMIRCRDKHREGGTIR